MQTVQRLQRSGIGIGPDRTIAHAAQVMELSGSGSWPSSTMVGWWAS
jgi:hypothetical protein